MNELGQADLDAYGEESDIGGIVIRAAGVKGVVTVYEPTASETRAETLESDALSVALENEEVDIDYIIEISDTEEIDAGPQVTTRSTAPGEKAIEIEVPAVGDGYAQILLVTDENGLASWHLPIVADEAAGPTRSGDTVTFIIPGYVAQTDDSGATRGFLGFLGKKIIRALSFMIVDKVIGEIGEFFVKKWEKKHRANRVRSLTIDNYRDNDVDEINSDEWHRLGEGPALLFIHGTFSRTSTAFSQIPPEELAEISKKYDGRVFAFDHPSVSEDPTENAKEFVRHMPKDFSLNVDIVCHSRGGHVSRSLAEDQHHLDLDGRKLNVRQVVFVASPNDGTILSDTKYMGDFIDTYTNILSTLPDNVVTDTLEIVIAVLKQMAVGVLSGLDGLQSMNPNGSYLKNVLNAGTKVPSRYRAISADFEPIDKKLIPLATDRLLDKIFKEQNDLVVPTEGVHRENGDPMFPIADVLTVPSTEGVHHGIYFSNKMVLNQLKKWLNG